MRLLSSLGVLVVGTLAAAACGDDPKSPGHPSAGGSAGSAGKGGSAGRGGNGGSAGRNGTGGRGGAAGTDTTDGGEGGATGGTGGANGGKGGNAGRGGSGGTGQAGSDAGAGGEAGGGMPFHGVYVGPSGDDNAPATRGNPVATLTQAAKLAKSGDTIVLLEGRYAESGAATTVVIPNNVDVQAETDGMVTLAATGGTLLDFSGSSNVRGLIFDGFETAMRAQAASGTVSVTKSSFVNCANTGQKALKVAGGATLSLSDTAAHDWGTCPNLAEAKGTGNLNITGGVIHFMNQTAGTVFASDEQGAINLDTLTATDGDRPLLLSAGSSVVSVTASTLSTLGSTIATLNGAASLHVDQTDVSIDPAAPFIYGCIQSNINGMGAISLTDSFVHGCSEAINGVPPATLTVTNTEIYDMSFDGLEFSTGDGGTVTITDSYIHDTTTFGARFFGGGGGTNIVDLTVRGTTIANVTESLRLQGAMGSTYDLGTLAEPGGNTFSATTTALAVLTQAGSFVSAVGNTWVPLQQGADDTGHYTAVGTGAVVEVTTGNGRNYNVPYGATLRLAENP